MTVGPPPLCPHTYVISERVNCLVQIVPYPRGTNFINKAVPIDCDSTVILKQ